MPAYAEQYTFPISDLSKLLALVSMTAKASSLIDIIPAVLRSGEPHAMSVELEAFVEEEVSRCPLPAAPCPLPAARVRCPFAVCVLVERANSTIHRSPPHPTAPHRTPPHPTALYRTLPSALQFRKDDYNKKKITDAIAKIKPEPPIPTVMGMGGAVEPAGPPPGQVPGPVEPGEPVGPAMADQDQEETLPKAAVIVPPPSAPAPVEAFAVTVDESSTAMTMKQWLDSVNMGFGDMFHDKFFEVGLDSVNILASGEIILAHFRRCCAFNNDVPR